MILPLGSASIPIREYFLGHLLGFEGEQLLSNLRGVDCRVGFEIEMHSGSLRYVLVLSDGVIATVHENWEIQPEIVYLTDDETFYRVVGGCQRAESAFLRGKIRIRGNILRGLKLAFLLQEFFDRFPYRPLDQPRYDGLAEEVDQASEVFPEDLIEEMIRITDDLPIKAVYREGDPPTFGAILVPPHPYLGGTSDNRLLHRLSSGLAAAGAFVVRFDYRQPTEGAAGSLFSFWEDSDAGHRMGDDELIEIHRWMLCQDLLSDSPILWIGYSYGAQVCLWTLERESPDLLTLISPVVSQIGEERFNCMQEALLVGGTDDFATPPIVFQSFSESMRVPPKARMIKDADHFFTGKDDDLMEALFDYLGDRRLDAVDRGERKRK